VIAKGARSPKNKFGSSLQPLSHVCAVLYKREHRDLHLLSQCDSISRFQGFSEDLEKFAAAMSVVEMVEGVAHDEERNDQLFELALGVLRAIDAAPKNAANLQFFFELHLSDVLGFKPNFHTCLSCGKTLNEEQVGTKGGELRFGNGGVLCTRCSDTVGGYSAISLGALRILQRLQETIEPGSVTQMKLTEHQTEEVRTILRQYLQSHVGGLQRLKAQSVTASIM